MYGNLTVPLEVDVNQVAVDLEVSGSINPVINADYEQLENKPQINGVELNGNKTFEELGEQTITNVELQDIINTQYQLVFGGDNNA